MAVGAKEARKGFYFSFDAFLALTIMVASLSVVAQSSSIASDPFRADSIEYRQASTAGQDAMKVASAETFESFNDSFQEELLDETVMEEEDLERNIVDGISLLWAARNFTHAEKVTETYFGAKTGDYNYRLQVNEGETETVVYESSEMEGSPKAVSSASRLVSGHRIDEPSEGFQARARATEAKTNQTEVFDIPMMGSGAFNNELRLEKKFNLEAEQIHGATLYFSAQWGQSNFESSEVTVNGQTLELGGSGDEDWIHYDEAEDAQFGFDIADISDQVDVGWNSFELEFNNQGDQHAHIQPGTRIEVEYEEDQGPSADGNWDYLTDIEGTSSNPNQRGGVWYNHPIQVPENAEIGEAYMELYVRDLENQEGEDLQVYLNDDLLHSEQVSGDVERTLEFGEELEQGTNVLSIYGNVDIQDGEINDFTAEGSNPRIYSEPENDPENSTRVYLEYDNPDTGLEFGQIDVVTTEEIGGLRENPKEFSQELDEGFEVKNTYLNLAQMDSINVSFEAGQEDLETVFRSPREYSTPSRIATGAELVDRTGTTNYRLEDECTETCDFLPESGLETSVTVPSQTGYGDLFENQSAAVEDAEQRLENMLGDYAEATSIETDEISTGSQPYLWGPASVKLVIWSE